MEARIIEHKSKKFIVVDFRGSKSEQDIINTAQQGLKLREGPSKITGVLANFTGVDHVYSEAYIKKIEGSVNKYGKEKIAIIGLDGINKALTTGVNSLIKSSNAIIFDTEEEAKEYLVS